MNQLEQVLSDRGSRYAVSGGPVADKEAALAFIKKLKAKKKFAKATHNTWALIDSFGTQIKNDDGESGAGAIMLRMLNEKGCNGHIVVVTRWYGGVHLGGDRFRHVKLCVQAYFDAFLKAL